MTPELTTAQKAAALGMFAAIAEAIRDLSAASPLGGVPSGELYARLTGKMSLGTYQSIISALVKAKLVDDSGFLLKWTGPAKEVTQ